MKKIRIGLVGYGFSATVFHLPFVASMEEFELVGLSTSRPAALAKDFPGLRAFRSAQELFSSRDVDAVIITSPNRWHFPLAKAALEAGKHVILEKPVVITEEEGDDLLQVQAESGKSVVAYQNRRWDSDFLSLRKVLDSGQLGKLSHFESHMDRYRPLVRDRWRERDEPGSGILYDLGSHLIDQALLLFGWPKSVKADIRIQRPGGKSVDYFRLNLAYEDFPVILQASSYVLGPQARYLLHGSKASYVKTGIDPQEAWLKEGRLPQGADYGVEDPDIAGRLYRPAANEGWKEEILPSQKGRYSQFYRLAAAHFRGEGENPVPLSQAVDNIRIIVRAMEAEGMRT